MVRLQSQAHAQTYKNDEKIFIRRRALQDFGQQNSQSVKLTHIPYGSGFVAW